MGLFGDILGKILPFKRGGRVPRGRRTVATGLTGLRIARVAPRKRRVAKRRAKK